MQKLKVLKVELEGITTSFRYPHFLVGRQPSLPLPPPSTIFGQIASALGEYPDPADLQFAYNFTCKARVDDLETQQILGVSTRKWDAKFGAIKNLEGGSGPGLRQLLLWPKLTLYLSSANLLRYYQAFREPRYAVVLGRSQDLATYTSVELVELEQNEAGYFENTILPHSYRNLTNAGVLTQMARYIDPDDRRMVDWDIYVTLETSKKPVFTSSDLKARNRTDSVFVEPGQVPFWVDPHTEVKNGRQRIVLFQTFIATTDTEMVEV
jgi:CRISPR-associated protein Cas5t